MQLSSYSVNSSNISLIATRLRRKAAEHQKVKCIGVPGIGEFFVVVGSEASVAVSPRLGEVDSDLA